MTITWVLILVFRVSSGTAAVTIPGYQTELSCAEASASAVEQRGRKDVEDAFCLKHP